MLSGRRPLPLGRWRGHRHGGNRWRKTPEGAPGGRLPDRRRPHRLPRAPGQRAARPEEAQGRGLRAQLRAVRYRRQGPSRRLRPGDRTDLRAPTGAAGGVVRHRRVHRPPGSAFGDPRRARWALVPDRTGHVPGQRGGQDRGDRRRRGAHRPGRDRPAGRQHHADLRCPPRRGRGARVCGGGRD